MKGVDYSVLFLNARIRSAFMERRRRKVRGSFEIVTAWILAVKSTETNIDRVHLSHFRVFIPNHLIGSSI